MIDQTFVEYKFETVYKPGAHISKADCFVLYAEPEDTAEKALHGVDLAITAQEGSTALQPLLVDVWKIGAVCRHRRMNRRARSYQGT